MTKSFKVFAYNDQDDKLLVYQSASFPEAVSVAQALYSASELELKILNSKDDCIVSFIRPFVPNL